MIVDFLRFGKHMLPYSFTWTSIHVKCRWKLPICDACCTIVMHILMTTAPIKTHIFGYSKSLNLFGEIIIFYLLYNTPIGVKHPIKQQRIIHLYKHTENCYTDEEPLFLNSSDCFIKVLTTDITVNVRLSKYSSFCMHGWFEIEWLTIV